MVSQFISTDKVPLLTEIDFAFPEGTHAIGRLDINSEGLLLLTTNKKITRLLFQDSKPHERVYLVMVRNIVGEERLQQIRNGVSIRIGKDAYYTTPPCDVTVIDNITDYINFGYQPTEYVPYTWLRIPLAEGKFRQVRKMVAAIHHTCIRLVRYSIEDIKLGNIKPGEVYEMNETEFFDKLKLDKSKA